MREAYLSELDSIITDLTTMADAVESAIRDASASLLNADLTLGESVIERDVELNERQSRLDERIIQLLALQAPVAGDLRLLISALRSSSLLERMGDLAAHIAIIGRGRHPQCAVPERYHEQFARMGELAVAAIADTAKVIATRDVDLAQEVKDRDDELDDLQKTIYSSVMAFESASNADIMDLILLGRFYERFGDHAVSIARLVGFLVNGDHIDA